MAGKNSNIGFRALSVRLWLRERRGHPERRLQAAGLRAGHIVLDYGCGIGSFSLPAAQLVGPRGQVHALDIHPLAVQTVRRRAARRGLSNVQTVQSDCDTGLPDSSVDVVLLYDVFHAVTDQGRLLRELHRILKPDGCLSVVPDHMSEDRLLQTLAAEGLFALESRRGDAYQFSRQNGKP
jgi:ubiquinone/menaquinone biosynthesis C-methylase UbiE